MCSKDLKDILCRTCLTTLCNNQTKFDNYHIFNTENLGKKLMLCSSLPVESTDEYPQQVCLECFNKILTFYEFQQMCSKSLENFKKLLETTDKVKQDAPVVDDEDNDPLINHIKAGYVFEKDQILDANLCAEHEINLNLLNSSIKKKRGRPPKKLYPQYANKNIKPKRKCGNVKKKGTAKPALGEKQMVHSKNKLKTQIEVMLGVGAMSDNKHPMISETGLTNVTEPIENAARNIQENVKRKTNISEEEMTLSECDSDSSNLQIKSSHKRAYKCDRCEDSFYILHRLEAHKRKHDGLPAYSCTFAGCDRNFNLWHYYKEHQKAHKNTHELYKCDFENCVRVYKNKSALNIHKRKYHNQGPALKSHMCEICGKVFKSSAVLNDHRYTHIDRTQLPYVCEEQDCSKRFSNKEKLKIHKMRHAGIKNFICPYCGMRKTTRNELKIHINYHTLERTWPCNFCSKVCNSAGNLKTHVKNMHEGAKDFTCRFCERSFAKADTKKYHEMTHTGEKPHECKECGKRFVQPAALRTHGKIHLRQKSKIIKKVGKVVTEQNVLKNSKDVDAILDTEAIVSDILYEINPKD